MKMHTLVIGLVLLALAACSDVETVERRNAEGIVTERFSRSKADSLMEGVYEAYDDSGVLMERANYKRGRLDGVRTLYYPDGAIQYEEHHVAGEFSGTYTGYYPDGQKELEGQYVDNKMSGVWTAYYPNGTIKEKVTFADNQENGPFTEWYSNGVIKAQGEYLNGDNEQGELVLYDLQGEVNKRMYCESGICKTVWRANKEEGNEG
jgi:antitoxin component YwqK of YwqJK toxin-antitoxin module